MPVQFHDFAPPADDFRQAVLAGLAQTPKRLPSRFIYDERGSHLFEAILEEPEYYVPRVEIGLLRACGAEIAALAGPRAYVVDYGSGSGRKARLLLDALARAGRLCADRHLARTSVCRRRGACRRLSQARSPRHLRRFPAALRAAGAARRGGR